jgi:hypothetical protein
MSVIRGSVRNQRGDALPNVNVAFLNTATGGVNLLKSRLDGEYNGELSSGSYSYLAFEEGYAPAVHNIAINGGGAEISVPVIVLTESSGYPSVPSPSSPPTSDYGDEVDKLFGKLADPDLDLEPKVSLEEARQSIGLFSVANLMLAGLSTRRVGDRDRTDILGVLNLFYGWQDKTLFSTLTLEDSASLWDEIEDELGVLAKDLDKLQSDVEFLRREAKRQFNIGTTNSVQANAQFPALFRRYVDIGSDPRLSIDIRAEKQNNFFDKAKLAEVYDLLRNLKEVIVQIVRSLSKYGTTATRRVNKDWADFEEKALTVLEIVAARTVSEDVDDKNLWSVMSVLIGQNRESIIPYVALGKHGALLLRYALEIYFSKENSLSDYSEESLEELFQSSKQASKDWWTTKIRSDAMFVKRYPLPNWG